MVNLPRRFLGAGGALSSPAVGSSSLPSAAKGIFPVGRPRYAFDLALSAFERSRQMIVVPAPPTSAAATTTTETSLNLFQNIDWIAPCATAAIGPESSVPEANS